MAARPIFISHATADAPLIDEFVDTILRLGCGVQTGAVLYSSGAPTGVPTGVNLNAYIRKRVDEATLVIAIVTPTYRTSAWCLAELGAAWSRAGEAPGDEENLLPLVLPGMDPGTLDGVLGGLLVRSITNDAALDELQGRVCRAANTSTDVMTWNDAKRKWLEAVPELVAKIRWERVPDTVACARDPAHMDLFWTDSSGTVHMRQWAEAVGWSEAFVLEGAGATHLAAVSRWEGDEWLFGVGDYGEVWARRWVQNRAGEMEPGNIVRIPGEVCGPLSAVRRGADELELSAWTIDGHQCRLRRTGGNWTPWSTEWLRH